MESRDDFRRIIETRLANHKLVVVSNREPYIHSYHGSEIQCITPASGLTIALDPVVQACGGAWIAHGSGNADKRVVDEHHRIRVPPDDPKYTLRRVWLSRDEEEGHYYGFSNQALWPLCHIVFSRPNFDQTHWDYYRKVNQKFAEVVLEEIEGKKAVVLIQDYHFTLLPRLIKERRTDCIVAQFWHIPWPNPEAFRICPWKVEILEGLLSNDLMGFHIRYHCNNFLETVNRELECRIDHERSAVVRKEKITLVRPFPISVDFDQLSVDSQREEVDRTIQGLKKKWGLQDKVIGVGVDRIDYTKGIPERLKAVDRFLDKYPEYKGRFVFIQAGPLSRIHIRAYKSLVDEIESLAEEINWKHGMDGWEPILLFEGHHDHTVLNALYRLAHFCLVTSLHDGMNLVAKEFVAARADLRGALILSSFTGAARELETALIINPYNLEEMAEAIHEAISMPSEEQERRMARLRQIVQKNNIYQWAEEILLSLIQLVEE